jgi:hypothetical protein
MTWKRASPLMTLVTVAFSNGGHPFGTVAESIAKLPLLVVCGLLWASGHSLKTIATGN